MGKKKYLNIGCGKQPLPGFINIDLEPGGDIQHDATQGLPFPDASVDGVYSEHFLEHLTQAQGLAFLRECRRVLKPEGAVRIAMPDLDEIAHRYSATDWRGDGDMFKLGFHWVDNRCEMLNICMREWGHQWVYNEEELRLAAQRAGLAVKGRMPWGESQVEAFVGLETRPGSKLVMEFTHRPLLSSRQPLVSILIPAYNPRFFEQSLASALAQTYENVEILICDDCRDGGIRAIVEKFDDARIRYEFNPEQQGCLGNYVKCLSLAKGELVKFLNDDDTLAPNGVERMARIFVDRPDVVLVTSYRAVIDGNNNRLPDFFSTSPLVSEDKVIEGRSFVSTVLNLGHNIIGEPTTVMFRKDDGLLIRPNFMSFGGEVLRGAGDMGTWLSLLSMGNAAYLREPLSCLRIHDEQRQKVPEIHEAGQKSWDIMRFHAHRLGMYDKNIKSELRISPLELTEWTNMPSPVPPEDAAPLNKPPFKLSLAARIKKQLDRHLLWRFRRLSLR
jgi:predicted SAM-dependent methyltransferase/glycosyltransferase involved in cell wall biosynthesis